MTVATVNFGSGQNITMVTVPLIEDSIYEGSEFETFTVGLRATGMGEVNIGDVGMVTVRLTENDGENLMCTNQFSIGWLVCERHTKFYTVLSSA